MIQSASWRRGISLALLVGLVSAYTIRSWHNPDLHHHPVCNAKNDLHFHQEHEACVLCDFVFSLPLPVSFSEMPSWTPTNLHRPTFSWTDAIPANIRIGYPLRGPPALV
ncbi:MAG: hypothetical protein KDC19_12065 [Saprospiraceae bacterium]|nr:hypothetical protein [Saprospiraceae bacterium]